MSEKTKKILYWILPPIYVYGIYYLMISIGNSGIAQREIRYLLEAAMALAVWIAFLLITKKPLFNKKIFADKKNFIFACLPGLIIVLNIAWSSIDNLKIWNPSSFFFAVTLGIEAGVLEEIQARGLIVNTAMQLEHTKTSAIIAVIYSSLLFGLEHFFNLSSGADIGPTVRTVVFATCCGLYFVALYLRVGSIIPCIIFHGLIDGLMAYQPLVDTATQSDISTAAAELPIMTQIINGLIPGGLLFLIPALFMLRKSKWDKILDNFK